MSISIKRATGVMGGTSKIDVLVNDKKVNKLKNNEEIVISTETEDSKIKVKQWFLVAQIQQLIPIQKSKLKSIRQLYISILELYY